jgi:2-polyprenyl-3-methyl-5-hydroxy-6-metoxy-1,4-benzoquinol methylase
MSPASAQERPCPICDGEKFWPVSFIDPTTDRVVRRTSGYHWRLCKTCGNATPSQVADCAELQAYWEKNRIEQSAFEVTDAVWEKRMGESRVWGERTYEFVSPWVRTEEKRFLDIGCGLGGTVATFASHGWKALGLDPDPNTKPFHEHLGIDSVIGRIEETEIPPAFDVIGIAHAIYFIQDPRGFVRRMRTLLSPGGLFAIVSTHLFSPLHVGRPAFVHTWYPTKASLIFLLTQEGFELVDARTMKGSDLLLFRPSSPREPKPCSGGAWWLHRTQGLRRRTLGVILRAGLATYRSLRKFISRA